MTSTTGIAHKSGITPTVRRRSRARRALNMTIHAGGSDAFRSLSMKERERILEEFRIAFAPAFSDMTVDEYIADRRKEAAREA